MLRAALQPHQNMHVTLYLHTESQGLEEALRASMAASTLVLRSETSSALSPSMRDALKSGIASAAADGAWKSITVEATHSAHSVSANDVLAAIAESGAKVTMLKCRTKLISIGHQTMTSISKIQGLERLAWFGGEIAFDISEPFQAVLYRLKRLYLCNVSACEIGVFHRLLAAASNLEHLNIACCEVGGDALLRGLFACRAPLPQLRTLTFFGQQLSDEDVQDLCCIKSLQSISLKVGVLTGAQCVALVRELPALESVVIRGREQLAWAKSVRTDLLHAALASPRCPIVHASRYVHNMTMEVRVVRDKLLAFMHSQRNAAGRFLRNDGDHALMTRVMGFMQPLVDDRP
jgi:hypothetical protein